MLGFIEWSIEYYLQELHTSFFRTRAGNQSPVTLIPVIHVIHVSKQLFFHVYAQRWLFVMMSYVIFHPRSWPGQTFNLCRPDVVTAQTEFFPIQTRLNYISCWTRVRPKHLNNNYTTRKMGAVMRNVWTNLIFATFCLLLISLTMTAVDRHIVSVQKYISHNSWRWQRMLCIWLSN